MLAFSQYLRENHLAPAGVVPTSLFNSFLSFLHSSIHFIFGSVHPSKLSEKHFPPSTAQSATTAFEFIYSTMADHRFVSDFEDSFPLMAEKLGGDGLIGELCKGFRLLMDAERGVITFESLKRNAPLLGLQGLSDADLKSMISAGDFDGDGALSEMEFCVMMFRLSPELMESSEDLLDEALQGQPADGFRF